MMKTLASLDPETRSFLEQQARENPGKWVYEIDYVYPANQQTPTEAIRGAWEVDQAGLLLDSFKENPNYRPIQVSDRPLPQYMHNGAKSHPGWWITDVAESGEHLFPKIPKDQIRGWWLVGLDGKITQQLGQITNSRNRPIRTNSTASSHGYT